MTELEQQLMSMLEQERNEIEREREEVAIERRELASTLQSINRQQQQIIELLSKPEKSEAGAVVLSRVLNDFQSTLIESLTQSLKRSQS